jgi:hypothetical protein
VWAAPDPFDPHQGDWPTPRGQVPDPDRAPVVQHCHRGALRAAHQIRGRLDRLLTLAVVIRHGQHHEPDTASTTNPGRPNIAAAALRSRSTWGLSSPCPEHHGP